MPLGQPLLNSLDAMGYGGVVLDAAGEVLRLNGTAARLLAEHQDQDGEGGLAGSRRALTALLQSAGINGVPLHEDNWSPVASGHPRRSHPLIIRTIPLENSARSGPHKVMILIDLDVRPRPTAEVLKRVFGFTPTETRLAIELTGGKSPGEAAAATGVSVATVRKQLATMFSKTNTHRQSELLALLWQLSILP